jgi:hypothetical protein
MATFLFNEFWNPHRFWLNCIFKTRMAIMKKLLLIVFALIITLPSFAALKEKDLIGTWKYKVETDQGDLTGTITFEIKEGTLTGVVNTDDGAIFVFSKLEFREKDMVYMELDDGSELLKISATVKGKTLNGTVSNSQGDLMLHAEKIK